MLKHITIPRLFLVLALVQGWGIAQQVPDRMARGAKSSLQRPTLQPPAPAQPMRALTGEELPAVAPQVVCKNGLVTLNAQNSTLVSVLRAVAGCTHALLDMPDGVGITRVAARLGPAQPTALFAALLNGSLDYIILKSNRNPEQVRMVMVRPRQAVPTGVGPQSAAFRQDTPTAVSQAATFIDEQGVERLPSGLTPDEALLRPEELAKKFEAAREQQRRTEGLPPPPNPPQP